MENPTSSVAEVHILPADLNAFVRVIWESAGSSAREAALVADHLVMANLTGHDSHGVGMIPRYVRSLQEGGLKLNGHAEIVRDAGALLTIEGGSAFGQVLAHEAMDHGIERASKLGIAAVALRNAHHIGRIGHWAEQCAQHGLVSFHFVNVAGFAQVAPYGGVGGRFGTNPFCAAFPRKGKEPLVLDFATSSIAMNKTRVAYNKGLPVPPDCLMDHEGRPTTDPRVMHEAPFGSLKTFGGHKGYGMAAMCELFAGALSGGYTTHEETRVKGSAIINCMLSVIIDPSALDAADADAEADAFIAWIRKTPTLPGHAAIQLPGEPERRLKAERSVSGIPIDETTWKQIGAAAQAVGVPAGRLASVPLL
jgi:hydroxycarboxylate dehydrogenase B